MDAQGIEIVENQKESVVGRKALADRTKGSLCDLSYWHKLSNKLPTRVQEDS